MSAWDDLVDLVARELELAALVAEFREQFPAEAAGVSDKDLRADFLEMRAIGLDEFALRYLDLADPHTAALLARAGEGAPETAPDPCNRARSP